MSLAVKPTSSRSPTLLNWIIYTALQPSYLPFSYFPVHHLSSVLESQSWLCSQPPAPLRKPLVPGKDASNFYHYHLQIFLCLSLFYPSFLIQHPGCPNLLSPVYPIFCLVYPQAPRLTEYLSLRAVPLSWLSPFNIEISSFSSMKTTTQVKQRPPGLHFPFWLLPLLSRHF